MDPERLEDYLTRYAEFSAVSISSTTTNYLNPNQHCIIWLSFCWNPPSTSQVQPSSECANRSFSRPSLLTLPCISANEIIPPWTRPARFSIPLMSLNRKISDDAVARRFTHTRHQRLTREVEIAKKFENSTFHIFFGIIMIEKELCCCFDEDLKVVQSRLSFIWKFRRRYLNNTSNIVKLS